MTVDVEPGYRAAREGVAVLPRSGRRFLEVTGTAAGDMLKGILSGTIPGPLRAGSPERHTSPDAGVNAEALPGEPAGLPEDGEAGTLMGEVYYSTLLTPKGRMVTDLRILPLPSGGFLLELPEVGFPGATAYFKKFLNPRFAQTRDLSRELAMVSVVGPEASESVAKVLGQAGLPSGFGKPRSEERESGRPESGQPESGKLESRKPESGKPESGKLESGKAPQADGLLVIQHPRFGPVLVLENPDPGVAALDLVVEAGAAGDMEEALKEAGADPLSTEAWDVLRIEAGTPVFGKDMTEETIPVEAGIHLRAVDYQKGCYTGQEFIIRLRDRGKVNKTLRRILLGEAPVPEPGTEFFSGREGRSRGWVTSACASPWFGQTVALGYVKRGQEEEEEIRLGGTDGPSGRVESI